MRAPHQESGASTSGSRGLRGQQALIPSPRSLTQGEKPLLQNDFTGHLVTGLPPEERPGPRTASQSREQGQGQGGQGTPL